MTTMMVAVVALIVGSILADLGWSDLPPSQDGGIFFSGVKLCLKFPEI